MHRVLPLATLFGCLTSDSGEARSPCSSPETDWVSSVDGEWSTDCSVWNASEGDHLCVTIGLDDCHDCTSGLEADPASVEVADGATIGTSKEEFGELKVDLRDVQNGIPVEFTFVIRCEAGTHGTFRAASDLVGKPPAFSWSMLRH